MLHVDLVALENRVICLYIVAVNKAIVLHMHLVALKNRVICRNKNLYISVS